jgi:hypothetical protein
MTLASQPALSTPVGPSRGEAYEPGACNIGPEEIARRRRAGHVGLGVAVAVLAGLAVVDSPRLSRLLVVLPATVSASGYLQARFRFCAGFGSRGIYNFGEVGQTVQVEDADARRRDRTRSRQIGLASLAIGTFAGILAVGLPR